MTQSLKIIISGGGTGGHIFPAIAIARAILKINAYSDILFIGANGKMEMEKVSAAGFPIKGIDIIGLQRKLTLKNFFIPYYLLKSIQQVKNIFKEFHPHLVIGTGGYVSFPVLMTAQLQKIPSYIQEQNAYAGLTNKILAQYAQKIFVAFDDMEKFFPTKKIVKVGNPVREDLLQISQIDKQAAANHFSLQHNHPIILVLGGSLGAKTINECIAQHLHFFTQHNIQLIWQMGKNYYQNIPDDIHAQLKQSKHIFYKDFIDAMNMAYAAADIIVSRAGASTIAELSIVGKAAILIPSPNVTADHQTKNAMALVKKSAAILIKDNEVGTQLIPQIQQLIQNPPLQKDLSKNIQSLAQPKASMLIAEHILSDYINIHRPKYSIQ